MKYLLIGTAAALLFGLFYWDYLGKKAYWDASVVYNERFNEQWNDLVDHMEKCDCR